METKETTKAVTFILSGSLLQMFNGVSGGFWSGITALIGVAIFFIGLSSLKKGIDEQGKSAISLLIIAAIVSGIGYLLGLIPLVGIVGSIFLLAAFIVELIGYLRLKNSNSIQETGKKGVNLLLVAMVLGAVSALLGIIPFLGGVIVSICSLAGTILILLGWVKIQEGLS